MSEIIDELEDRCQALQHAMQSGVEMWRKLGLSNETTVKHLRTGVNSVMCDHGALIKVLIDNGVISLEAYMRARIEMLERDVKSYEQKLAEHYGRPVTLA